MTKKIVVAFLAVIMVFGCTYTTAQAQTMDLAQLIELFISLGIIPQDKVTAARAIVTPGGVTGNTGTTMTGDGPSTCGQLSINLTVGSMGKEVSFLQQKLGMVVTGYFGDLTKQALMTFQTNNGITPTGFFDPVTREKFNTLYGCNTSTDPIIPTIAIIGTPSISTSQTAPFGNNNGTTTIAARFNIQITATGSDFSFESGSQKPFIFTVTRNGVRTSGAGYPEATAEFVTPQYGVITTNIPAGTSFKIPQNNTVTIPVTFYFVPTGSSAIYSVGLESVRFVTNGGSRQTSGVIKGVDTATVSASGPAWTGGTVVHVVTPTPTPTVTTSIYHSADTNKDWKISEDELARLTVLFNYRVYIPEQTGYNRTGEYHISPSSTDGYDIGPGSREGKTHSADTNKDWRIDASELSRVVAMKNGIGYKIEAGTVDGFAPIPKSSVVLSRPLACGSKGDLNNDGRITKDDYEILSNVVAGTVSSTNSIADIDGNGSIEGADFVLLGRYLNNLETTFKGCTTTSTQSRPLACGSKGDLNNDGRINREDSELLSNVVVGNTSSTNAVSDINGDGEISVSDWVLLGRYVNGLDTTLKSCTVNTTNSSQSSVVATPTPIQTVTPTPTPTVTKGTCTDSDGGQNPSILGTTDGRVNGSGSYFTDLSVASNGGQCSGDSCTAVAEGYCTSDGKVTNTLMFCSTGYSANGACATKPVITTPAPQAQESTEPEPDQQTQDQNQGGGGDGGGQEQSKAASTSNLGATFVGFDVVGKLINLFR